MCKRKLGKLLCIYLVVVAISLSMLIPVFATEVTAYVFNQTITAYRSSQGAVCASGSQPYVGAAAMRPRVENDVSSGPIFPYGAVCTLETSVPMYSGGYRNFFWVEDVGDVDYAGYESDDLTYSWLDIWQGTGPIGGTIYNWCINTFETRRSNYSAYYIE